MKRILSLLLLLLLLAACTPAARYTADVPVDTLCLRALESLDREDLRLDTVGVIEDYFSMPNYVISHAILYSPETACIDEIGIFRVEGGNAAALAALLRDGYLAPAYEKHRDFYDSYIPGETPKLRDARVECYGDTVVYAILSAADQSTLFAAMRKALA